MQSSVPATSVSIAIYDVYKAYICSFKPNLKDGQSITCSKYLRRQKGDEDAVLCDCVSTAKCKPHFTCEAHKDYKEYQEHLLNYKNWRVVTRTFLSVPPCFFCWVVNFNLAWTYYFTGILISPSVIHNYELNIQIRDISFNKLQTINPSEKQYFIRVDLDASQIVQLKTINVSHLCSTLWLT